MRNIGRHATFPRFLDERVHPPADGGQKFAHGSIRKRNWRPVVLQNGKKTPIISSNHSFRRFSWFLSGHISQEGKTGRCSTQHWERVSLAAVTFETRSYRVTLCPLCRFCAASNFHFQWRGARSKQNLENNRIAKKLLKAYLRSAVLYLPSVAFFVMLLFFTETLYFPRERAYIASLRQNEGTKKSIQSEARLRNKLGGTLKKKITRELRAKEPIFGVHGRKGKNLNERSVNVCQVCRFFLICILGG